MATTSAPVFDVNERDFATAVLQRSTTTPVVVDFWAPWCGPCRALGPILERLAREANGAWLLAKVNVDQNPRLAAQFGVQGIPAVKAFRDGKVVAEFTGALPEREVRAWLKQVAPSQIEQWLALAQHQEASDAQAAAATYRRVLEREPDNATALLGLGRVLLLQGDSQATAILRQIKSGAPEYATAQALLALAPLLNAATGDTDAARAAVEANPRDPEARWQLAANLAQRQDWEGALEQLLTIVQYHRAWRDDAARQAMLAIFALLGESHALVRHYRQRLANALFG
ncbi:thioredoxin [Kallotenue papyrolyticum]|uniref:thioredoxin n=1 Tax=Kallotenue papyrolyticum TaxID=1325125 RepID=UPI000478529D|nr:thioredoxin [Kallotenue papyrolyticum]